VGANSLFFKIAGAKAPIAPVLNTPLITWLTLTGIQFLNGPWVSGKLFFPWANFWRWKNFHTWNSAHSEILYLPPIFCKFNEIKGWIVICRKKILLRTLLMLDTKYQFLKNSLSSHKTLKNRLLYFHIWISGNNFALNIHTLNSCRILFWAT
jgi:hypothetical protein